MKEYSYIYNFQQSLYFMQNGVIPVEIGKGSKDDVYHKFERGEKLDEVFTKWIESKPKDCKKPY